MTKLFANWISDKLHRVMQYYQYWLSSRFVADQFLRGLLPILTRLSDYLYSMKQQLFKARPLIDVATCRRQLVTALQTPPYPEWVYRVGFNPRLRGGFRYCLLKLEHLVELSCSCQPMIQVEIDTALADLFSPLFSRVLQNQVNLITVLSSKVASLISAHTDSKQLIPTADHDNDLRQLEKALSQRLPRAIELLDMQEDYLVLMAIFIAMQEIRRLLLELIRMIEEAEQRINPSQAAP